MTIEYGSILKEVLNKVARTTKHAQQLVIN